MLCLPPPASTHSAFSSGAPNPSHSFPLTQSQSALCIMAFQASSYPQTLTLPVLHFFTTCSYSSVHPIQLPYSGSSPIWLFFSLALNFLLPASPCPVLPCSASLLQRAVTFQSSRHTLSWGSPPPATWGEFNSSLLLAEARPSLLLASTSVLLPLPLCWCWLCLTPQAEENLHREKKDSSLLALWELRQVPELVPVEEGDTRLGWGRNSCPFLKLLVFRSALPPGETSCNSPKP